MFKLVESYPGKEVTIKRNGDVYDLLVEGEKDILKLGGLTN